MSLQQLKSNRLLKGLHEGNLRLIDEAGKVIRVRLDETAIYENRPNEYLYLILNLPKEIISLMLCCI